MSAVKMEFAVLEHNYVATIGPGTVTAWRRLTPIGAASYGTATNGSKAYSSSARCSNLSYCPAKPGNSV